MHVCRVTGCRFGPVSGLILYSYRTDVVILVSMVLEVLVKNIEVSKIRDLKTIPT